MTWKEIGVTLVLTGLLVASVSYLVGLSDVPAQYGAALDAAWDAGCAAGMSGLPFGACPYPNEGCGAYFRSQWLSGYAAGYLLAEE